jgi:hypothetical protein
MIRGHLIEEHRVDELQSWLEQFRADDHGHRTADEEHDQTEHQIHGADVFVVGREQPALDAGRRLIMMVVVVSGVARVRMGHGSIALYV